jgi:DNA polymerase-3 subunit epsilon
VRAALEGHVPVAYNAEFDRAFLLAEFDRVGVLEGRLPPALRKDVVWIDPLAWARELQKNSKSRALVDVCQRLGIELSRAHRAADDATATLQVLAALQQDARVPATYAAFMQEQQRLKRAFEEQKKLWRRG